MKKIAVLISVFNRKQKTLKCLEYLKAQDCVGSEFYYEVFLTNDGCTDGTPEAVSEQFPEVHIINGDGSLFWNRGMIEAWKEAAKEYFDFFLWLNDDVVLYSDAIQRLLKESANHDDKAVVGGSMCYSYNKEKVSYGGRVNKHHTITDVSAPQKCKTLAGNLVLIPHSVYQIIGMNDPYYRHNQGDLDYTLRVCEAGLEVWLAKGIFGVCDREDLCPVWADPSKPLQVRWKNMMSIKGCNPRSGFYFDRKHYGILCACYRYVLCYIHVFFPFLWNKRRTL